MTARASSDVQLKVGGQVFTGWTEVSVQKNMNAIAGSFSLSSAQRFDALGRPFPIQKGEAAEVWIGSKRVICGFIDRRSPSLSVGNRSIALAGRDRAGDLVDCSPKLRSYQFFNVTLLGLTQLLCKPFGIAVTAEVSAGKAFPVWNVDPGESIFQTLEKAARRRGVIFTSDEAGNIRITAIGKRKAVTELVESQNLLSGERTDDLTDRFSEYIVKSQTQGSDEFSGDGAAAVQASAQDKAVPRYRPKVIISESQATTDDAKVRASWEAKVRAARGSTARVVVQDWFQGDGSIWEPNTVVRIRSPFLELDGELLISGVNFQKSGSNGTTTELELSRKDAFIPEPEVEPSDFDVEQD